MTIIERIEKAFPWLFEGKKGLSRRLMTQFIEEMDEILAKDFVERIKFISIFLEAVYGGGGDSGFLDNYREKGLVMCDEASDCFGNEHMLEFLTVGSLKDLEDRLERLSIGRGYHGEFLHKDIQAIPYKTWTEFEENRNKLKEFAVSLGLEHLIR